MRKKTIDIVKEVREDFEERRTARKNIEAAWLLNINFLTGNQYSEILPTGEIGENGKRYYWQEREVYNHIAPIIETRLAKFGGLRASVTVRPATSDREDIEAAKFSTMLLRSIEEENNMKALIDEATFWSEVTGTAFYKIVWAGEKGRKLLDGEEALYEGDVEISVCPPYEIYPDSLMAAGLEGCRSLIHAKAYPVDAIEDNWGVKLSGGTVNVVGLDAVTSGGGFGYSAKKTKFFSAGKENHEVVIERYTLPSGRYPNGRLTIVAGEKLLFDGDLPYSNKGEGKRGFPFIRQVCLMQPAAFFGASVIDRLVPVQRAYNAVKNRKHEYMNRMAMGILMVEDGSVDLDNIEDEGLAPGKIVVYRQGSNIPVMMNMGSVPSDFRDEEDRLLAEFITVSGVSDFLTSSAIRSSNLSGVALSLIIEQDNSRLSLTADNIRNAVKESGQHILRLYRQFATTKRLRCISGENGELEMKSFLGSDITSDDLVFDIENEIINSPASRKSMVTELMGMGLLSDENGKISDANRLKILEMLGFGNWESAKSIEELHRKYAIEENENAAKCTPEVKDTDSHSVHIREHIRYLIGKECELSGEQRESLRAHVRQHKTYQRLQNEAEKLSQ